MSDPHNNYPSGSILRRLIALIYDGFLLLGITFGYGVVVLLVRMILGDDTTTAPNEVESVFIMLGLWLSYSAFYLWCWRKSGQTLGMKSWRLQLRDQQGQTPSIKQCWLRCIVTPPLLLLGGIGYLWCLLDKQGNSLQDVITQTRVQVLPKPQKH